MFHFFLFSNKGNKNIEFLRFSHVNQLTINYHLLDKPLRSFLSLLQNCMTQNLRPLKLQTDYRGYWQ